MRSSQHKGRVSKAYDKKHMIVNIVVLALCSFVCPSVWFLPGDFQLPGFLHEENPVGPCVWGSQWALTRYRRPFLWNRNTVSRSTNSFQKSLVVCSVWILLLMSGMGEGSRDTHRWQLKEEEIWTKGRRAGCPVVHWSALFVSLCCTHQLFLSSSRAWALSAKGPLLCSMFQLFWSKLREAKHI